MNLYAIPFPAMGVREKIRFAKNISSTLIANQSAFPNQPVAAADLQDFTISLEQTMANAEAARAALGKLLSAQNGMVSTLDDCLKKVIPYVEGMDGGPAMLDAAGLKLPEPARRVG